MKFMKKAFAEFHQFQKKLPRVQDSIYHLTFVKCDFYRLHYDYFNKKTLLTGVLSMTSHVLTIMLLHMVIQF